MFLQEPKFVVFLEQRLRSGEIAFSNEEQHVGMLLQTVVDQKSNLGAAFVLHLAEDDSRFEKFTLSVGLTLLTLNLVGFIKIKESGITLRSSLATLIENHLRVIRTNFLTIGEILDPWDYATAPFIADLKPTALQSLFATAFLLDKKLAEPRRDS